jgi:hypothetical protein
MMHGLILHILPNGQILVAKAVPVVMTNTTKENFMVAISVM